MYSSTKKLLKVLLINLYLKIERYLICSNILSRRKINNNILTKKQKLSINKFYKTIYGHKIAYTTHNLITNYTNKFDINYISPNIFLKFVDTININSYCYKVFKDKNFLYDIAKLANVKAPKRYFYSINGLYFDSNNNIISKEYFFKQLYNIGTIFIKPTIDTGGAKGCKILNIIDGVDIISKKNIIDIINNNYKTNFVIQEKIICHKSISNIYSKSVNHFDIFTYIWNNKINITPSLLNIGFNGNIIDFNFNQGCLFIGMNNDGLLYDNAFSSKNLKKYYKHPDTNVVFKNYKIELFPKVLDTAKKLHSVIPWLKFCKWDITINDNGEPIVLEMEKPTNPLSIQIANAKGIFENNTEDILSFLKNKI